MVAADIIPTITKQSFLGTKQTRAARCVERMKKQHYTCSKFKHWDVAKEAIRIECIPATTIEQLVLHLIEEKTIHY